MLILSLPLLLFWISHFFISFGSYLLTFVFQSLAAMAMGAAAVAATFFCFLIEQKRAQIHLQSDFQTFGCDKMKEHRIRLSNGKKQQQQHQQHQQRQQ